LYLISLALHALAASNPLNFTPPSSVSLANSAAILCGTAGFLGSFLSSPVVSGYHHDERQLQTVIGAACMISVDSGSSVCVA
jgi:hypothetical protein